MDTIDERDLQELSLRVFTAAMAEVARAVNVTTWNPVDVWPMLKQTGNQFVVTFHDGVNASTFEVEIKKVSPLPEVSPQATAMAINQLINLAIESVDRDNGGKLNHRSLINVGRHAIETSGAIYTGYRVTPMLWLYFTVNEEPFAIKIDRVTGLTYLVLSPQ